MPEAKQYALVVLVNFMLNQSDKSLLLELGIMDVFDSYRIHNLPIDYLPKQERFEYEIAIKSSTAYLFFQLCLSNVES